MLHSFPGFLFELSQFFSDTEKWSGKYASILCARSYQSRRGMSEFRSMHRVELWVTAHLEIQNVKVLSYLVAYREWILIISALMEIHIETYATEKNIYVFCLLL